MTNPANADAACHRGVEVGLGQDSAGQSVAPAAHANGADSIQVQMESLLEVVDGLERMSATRFVDALRVHYLLNELEALQYANPVFTEALSVIAALEEGLEELRDWAGGLAYDVRELLDDEEEAA